MNRFSRSMVLFGLYVPRGSGDEPSFFFLSSSNSAMFPAGAGMNRGLTLVPLLVIYVPRGSGDEPLAACALVKSHECSPRERG